MSDNYHALMKHSDRISRVLNEFYDNYDLNIKQKDWINKLLKTLKDSVSYVSQIDINGMEYVLYSSIWFSYSTISAIISNACSAIEDLSPADEIAHLNSVVDTVTPLFAKTKKKSEIEGVYEEICLRYCGALIDGGCVDQVIPFLSEKGFDKSRWLILRSHLAVYKEMNDDDLYERTLECFLNNDLHQRYHFGGSQEVNDVHCDSVQEYISYCIEKNTFNKARKWVDYMLRYFANDMDSIVHTGKLNNVIAYYVKNAEYTELVQLLNHILERLDFQIEHPDVAGIYFAQNREFHKYKKDSFIRYCHKVAKDILRKDTTRETLSILRTINIPQDRVSFNYYYLLAKADTKDKSYDKALANLIKAKEHSKNADDHYLWYLEEARIYNRAKRYKEGLSSILRCLRYKETATARKTYDSLLKKLDASSKKSEFDKVFLRGKTDIGVENIEMVLEGKNPKSKGVLPKFFGLFRRG